jgi:hypothetical protein
MMEKKDIAINQLRSAAKLYNSKDYISSITLSGAAEEILGRIAKKRTNSNQLEKEIEYLRSVYNYFSGQNPSNKILIEKINSVKNELKHNDSGENEWVSADFENEAAMLFIKGVKNYFDCYQDYPKDRIIRSLFEHLTL